MIADVTVAGMADELVRQAIDEALQRGLVTHRALELQARRRKGRAAFIIFETLKEAQK
jgi:hypothetical protein